MVNSMSPFLYGVDVGVKQPQLLCTVLPGGEDEVVSGEAQGPLYGGHEGTMEDNPVHPGGLYQLSKLHDLKYITCYEK